MKGIEGECKMASVKNVLILGGYGRIGLELAKLLLKHTGCDIWLAGREPIKAARAAREFNSICFEERASGLEVNAFLKAQLVRAFEKADLVINTIPITGPEGKIARAALESGIHYVDLCIGGTEAEIVRQFDEKVREAGLTFIIEAGFAVGTPSLMTRYISGLLDSVDRLTAYGTNSAWTRNGLPAWLAGRSRGKVKTSPQVSSVSVSGKGISNGRGKKLVLTVGHRDAVHAAAVAALPCVLGLVEGSISRPGVHQMGGALDPDRYLGKLWDMGMSVSLRTITPMEQMGSRSDELPILRSGELQVF
jgi:hypothetical protein